jgi:hypothetical protein
VTETALRALIAGAAEVAALVAIWRLVRHPAWRALLALLATAAVVALWIASYAFVCVTCD